MKITNTVRGTGLMYVVATHEAIRKCVNEGKGFSNNPEDNFSTHNLFCQLMINYLEFNYRCQ
jgi:hypothetical protein